MAILQIDPAIISPQELEERLKQKVVLANITVDFEDDSICNYAGGDKDMIALRARLMKIYKRHQHLNNILEIRDVIYVSHKPVIGKGIVFVKRAIRKVTRWLVAPYISQINAYHANLHQTIGEMIKLQEMLIDAYQRRNDEP